MTYKAPQFKNIDFDVFFSEIPKHLIQHFDRIGMSIMYAGKNFHTEHKYFGESIYLMCLETPTYAPCNETISEFLSIIKSLSGNSQKDWESADGLILDFGYGIAGGQIQNHIELPKNILEKILLLNASFKITTYIESDENWETRAQDESVKDIDELTYDEYQKQKIEDNKKHFGFLFEQFHQCFLDVNPLEIIGDYEFEVSELLSYAQHNVTNAKQISSHVKCDFRKYAMFSGIEEKCTSISKAFTEIWSNNREFFMTPLCQDSCRIV